MVLTPAPKERPAILPLLERGSRARTHHRSMWSLPPGPRQRGGNPSSPRPCRGRWALATGTPSCRRPRVWHRGGYLGARPVPFGTITAIDQQPAFLSALRMRRPRTPSGLGGHAHRGLLRAALPRESLDLIWSEGAIYTLGFAAGLAAWRPFLKERALAVTELTWLTDFRAEPLQAWDKAYPEVGTASTKFAILEQQGFRPWAISPPDALLAGGYEPLEASLPAFWRARAQGRSGNPCPRGERQPLSAFWRPGGLRLLCRQRLP